MRDQMRAFEAERHIQAALTLLERQNLEEAASHLKTALGLNPKDARAHVTLGVVFQMMGRPGHAAQEFTIALRLSPNQAPALFGLGATKAEAGEHQEAEELLRRTVELDPANVQAKLLLARTLRDLGRFDEAEDVIRAAIAAHPGEAKTYSALGIQLQQMGRFEDARALFSKAVELDPLHAFAYLGLVRGRRMSQADAELIESIRSLIANPNLRAEDRVDLLSCLGKALDDLGEYEQAMAAFSESNRLFRESKHVSAAFSRDDFSHELEATKTIFTSEFLERHRTPNEGTPAPIFIVGMMRSGTTLVEQIVSSHPDVAPGNEIAFWVGETYRCTDLKAPSLNLNCALGKRKKYNKILRRISQDAKFVTDKMPDNYRVLGMLNLLYPRAKIIHCRRHPVDTCLSILTTPLRMPPVFARDPEFLVFVYREYEKLMSHWRHVLPPETFFVVCYEDLIDDRERVTRQLIEFCGLPWDEACLRPEGNARPVVTASMWQARQPVYRTSVERWRNYEPWLGPLTELFEPPA